jgi:hypothetical protein
MVRVFVLEFHPPPPSIENYLYSQVLFLTPRALLSSVLVFLILALLKKIKVAEQLLSFFCSIVGWTFGGLGIASVIVIACTAYYNSSQGPFSIIFLDGPLGAGVGTVVGLVMWLLKIRSNVRSETTTDS